MIKGTGAARRLMLRVPLFFSLGLTPMSERQVDGRLCCLLFANRMRMCHELPPMNFGDS